MRQVSKEAWQQWLAHQRVYSPSAEVRGHGAGQEVPQAGKRDVEILSLEPSGNYAVQPKFSDGHDTGIYSWDYLYWLRKNREELWQKYLQRLEKAAASREPVPRLSSRGPNQSSGSRAASPADAEAALRSAHGRLQFDIHPEYPATVAPAAERP